MNRQAQAVVMLLLGGAVVRAGITGQYLRYVKPGLQPFLLVAGALLVAAAAMTLWYDLRGRAASASASAASSSGSASSGSASSGSASSGSASSGSAVASGDDDGHGHREPRVGWLLILPVLGLLLISPPALGSYAAGQAGTVLTAQNSSSDYPPLPAGDPVPVSLLDYASRALFDAGKSLTGRNLQLTGFVTPGPDGQPMLARIVLTCCAADGRPIKVGLTGNVPNSVPADTWVQLVGTYTPKTEKDPVNKADVPYAEVKTWTATAEPKNPYE